MMVVDVAGFADVRAVAKNMRESDFREFRALMHVDTRDEMVSELTRRYVGQDVIVARDGVTPIAIGRTLEARPNVITLAFFATDEFPRIGKPLTRFIRQRLFPSLRQAGVHRFECVSIVGHHEAHAWIQAIGLSEEAPLIGYGKNKEDFIQFAWVSDACKTRA